MSIRRETVRALEPGRAERRHRRRRTTSYVAELRARDLRLPGTLMNISVGGAFLRSNLLIELGEHGVLVVEGAVARVSVVWLRGNGHPDGPGMGLAFDSVDEASCILRQR